MFVGHSISIETWHPQDTDWDTGMFHARARGILIGRQLDAAGVLLGRCEGRVWAFENCGAAGKWAHHCIHHRRMSASVTGRCQQQEIIAYPSW